MTASVSPRFSSFVIDNAPWLATGALLSFLSSFGQTFFISIFAGEIRDTFGLTNGQWGGIYTLGTGASAAVMLMAGGLADRFRVRTLGVAVVFLLALACFWMSVNASAVLLAGVIFALRFTGQGMASHVALVAMARWFVATRGRALAVATMGFALGEATMPLSFVWLKRQFDWHHLWVAAGVFCLAMIPVLLLMLRTERTPASVAAKNASTGMDDRFWTRGEALRHPLFWSVVPALLFFPGFITAFWFHQVHFAEIKGWPLLSLVAVIPLGTLAAVLSTIGYGWAIDRWGSGRLMPVYMLPLCLAFTLHAFAPSVGWTALGIMLMGVAGGGQATLPAACWAEFYGTRHIGSIKAAVAAILVLGSALGPGLSGWLIDAGIDLPAQYLAYAVCFAVASVAMVPTLRAARARLPRAA